MNNIPIFDLYALVQKKNKKAEDELIRRWEKKFKRKTIKRGESSDYRKQLHIMYLNLT